MTISWWSGPTVTSASFLSDEWTYRRWPCVTRPDSVRQPLRCFGIPRSPPAGGEIPIASARLEAKLNRCLAAGLVRVRPQIYAYDLRSDCAVAQGVFGDEAAKAVTLSTRRLGRIGGRTALAFGTLPTTTPPTSSTPSD